MILLICEEINTAYNTKDLEYLEDLFGGDRLVLDMVVQQDSVKQIKGGKNIMKNLRRFFSRGEQPNFRMSEIEVSQSKRRASIYGITFKFECRSKYYSDDGYMFLLVELRDDEKPVVHVCAWHHGYPLDKDKIYSLEDFDF